MKTRLHGTTAGSLCSAHEERMLDQAQQEERQAGRQGDLCPCVSMSGQRILLFYKKTKEKTSNLHSPGDLFGIYASLHTCRFKGGCLLSPGLTHVQHHTSRMNPI